MDQQLINQNFVNSLSMLNKALMAQQERFVILLERLNDPVFEKLQDLILLDVQILNDLQKSLERMKEIVK